MRSWFDVNAFVIRTLYGRGRLLNWFFVLRAGIFISSVVAFYLGLQRLQIEGPSDWVGWVTLCGSGLMLLLSAVSLWQTLRSFFRMLLRLPSVRLMPDRAANAIFAGLQLPADLVDSGYECVLLDKCPSPIPGGSEFVVRSQVIDRLLRTSDILLQKIEQPPELNETLRHGHDVYEGALRAQYQTAKNAGKQFINEEKTCLKEDLLCGTLALNVCRGSYFQSFLTSELVSQKVETIEARPIVRYHGSAHYPASKTQHGDELRRLRSSGMADTIGVSTVVITQDGYLVLWRQSDSALQSNNLRVPTGSGSCDWGDFAKLPKRKRTLRNLISAGMQREFQEESSQDSSYHKRVLSRARINTWVLGHFRWVRRGGMPEFVGVSRVAVNKEALSPSEKEVDAPVDLLLLFPAKTLEQIHNSIQELKMEKDISVPLWMILVCLEEFLTEDPKGAAAILLSPIQKESKWWQFTSR